MNTKRKVNDYMGQDVAIYCSSKEEWDKIVGLINNGNVKKIHWQDEVNSGLSDTININGKGWSPKEYFIKKNYTIYPAFDFLEEDKPLWFKNYDSVAHFVKKSPHRNSFFKETDKIKTEVISEYVEATSKFDCYIIPGYVYKVTDKTNIKSLQLECNIHTGKYSSGTKLFVGTHEFSFKESTKEAYEAQNKPKQLAGNNLLPNKIYVTDDPTDYIFKTSETSKGYSHYICPLVKKKDSKEQNFLDLRRIDREEFELMPEDFSPNEEKEWIPKVGDYIIYREKDLVQVTSVRDDASYKYWIDHTPNSFSGGGFGWTAYKDKVRKALPHEISNQHTLTPNERFSTTIYDFEEIYIPSITKKTKQLQTITIESTTDLNLGLTKIKSKQIQTIKI